MPMIPCPVLNEEVWHWRLPRHPHPASRPPSFLPGLFFAHRAFLVADLDTCGGRRRVLDHVGRKRLLDVGGQVTWAARLVHLDPHLDRPASPTRPPAAPGPPARVPGPAAWPSAPFWRRMPSTAHSRRAAGRLVASVPGLLRPGVHHVAADRRLHRDDAHRVRHHVVQFPADAQPFLGHRPAGRGPHDAQRRLTQQLRRDKPPAHQLTSSPLLRFRHVRHQRQSSDQALWPGPRGGRLRRSTSTRARSPASSARTGPGRPPP